MSFASGPVSYRRYRVEGWSGDRLDDEAVEQLGAAAFGQDRSVSSEAVEAGWIAPTHLFDFEIDADKITTGRFVHLAMRLDRLDAPAAVVRSYRRIEEEAALAASGEAFLTKRMRRDAKEAAQVRAAKEAQAGHFRRITAHPLVFDLEERIVYFNALGNGPHEKLQALFNATFDVRLTPLDASELAARITESRGLSRFLDDAEPLHLVAGPAGEGIDTGDFHDRRFLGREFLTWLWHLTDMGDGVVTLDADGRTPLPDSVSVMFVTSLQLDCDFFATGRTSVLTAAPTHAPEAKVALSVGKQPSKAGLIIAEAGAQYALTLDAQGFHVTGLRLPEVDEPSPAARFEERLMHIVRCAGILEAMYARFLVERFGGRFATTLNAMRQWGRRGAGGSTRDGADQRQAIAATA